MCVHMYGSYRERELASIYVYNNIMLMLAAVSIHALLNGTINCSSLYYVNLRASLICLLC